MDRPPWTDNFVPQQKKKKLGNWELKKKGKQKKGRSLSCLGCLFIRFMLIMLVCSVLRPHSRPVQRLPEGKQLNKNTKKKPTKLLLFL